MYLGALLALVMVPGHAALAAGDYRVVTRYKVGGEGG
jgi:hypothetical protein